MTQGNEDGVSVNIFANIGSLVSGFRSGASTVVEGSEEMAASVEGLTGSIEGLLAPLAAITALFEAFHFITEAIESTNEYGEQVRIASQKTGVAVEELQALQAAAYLADIDVGELTSGLGKLSKNLQEVATGGKGPAATAMTALGISATDTTGKLRPMEDVLKDVAEKFGTMEDGTTKTALAMDLFGRSGANLIPFLNEGRDGIAALEEKARELGIVMSEDDIAAAKQFDDEMKELHIALQSVEHSLALAVMPALIKFANWITEHIDDVEKFADAIWKLGTGFSFIAQMKRDREFEEMMRKAGEPTSKPKGAAPILPKTDPNAPSHLELLREEWNKRKQVAIDGEEDILQVEIDFWKLKLAAEQEGTKDYITIHSHLVDLEEQQQKKQTQELKKATEEWKRSLQSLPKAFASVIGDMQKNMGGFRDFMRDIWYEIVAMSAKAGFDMLAGWAAAELAKRQITQESAVQTIAIKTWEGIKWLAIHAAMAAAAAWSAIAGIPFVGPFLAPLAAAAALAGVLALGGAFNHGGGGGGGAPSVATTAGRNISASASQSGGGTTNIYAIDAKSFKDFAIANRSTFVAATKAGLKDNAGGGRV